MRTSKTFTGLAMTIAVLLVSAGLAAAAPPAGVGHDGKAGASNVYQCALYSDIPGVTDGYGWGLVHVKDLGDSVEFTVNVKGLTPGDEYELRSGGPLDPVVTAVANGGGNVTFSGSNDSWGARFNVWEVEDGDHRILRTAPDCTPEP